MLHKVEKLFGKIYRKAPAHRSRSFQGWLHLNENNYSWQVFSSEFAKCCRKPLDDCYRESIFSENILWISLVDFEGQIIEPYLVTVSSCWTYWFFDLFFFIVDLYYGRVWARKILSTFVIIQRKSRTSFSYAEGFSKTTGALEVP